MFIIILSARGSAWGLAACRILHCIWIQPSLPSIKRLQILSISKQKGKEITFPGSSKRLTAYHPPSQHREVTVVEEKKKSQKIQVQILQCDTRLHLAGLSVLTYKRRREIMPMPWGSYKIWMRPGTRSTVQSELADLRGKKDNHTSHLLLVYEQ